MHPEMPGNKYFSRFGQFWVIKFPPILEGEEISLKKELFSLRGELELELSLTRAPSKRLTAILVPRFP